MAERIEKVAGHTPDFVQANIDAIAALFPNVVTEVAAEEAGGGSGIRRAVDFDLLRQELADHLVEGPAERYRLDWPGKREAAFAANAPEAITLRPVREESVDFDTTKNLFIEGDNLQALKLLQDSYLGKVKLIYIDPPYNTGNDFIYDDDFAESTAEYLERSIQRDDQGAMLVANTESNGRFHSDWLSMMYPRLRLARNLLTDDGVIIVAIDDHEHSRLRILIDQVLGSENFIANVTWQGSGKNDARYTAGGVDYMLIYAKNEGLLRALDTRWKEPKPGLDEVEAVARNAWQQAGGDPAKATTIFRSGVRAIKADLEPAVFRYDQIDEEGRVFQATDLRSPNPRPNLQYLVTHPVTGYPVKMHPNGWVYSAERMEALIADGRIIFGPDETTSPRLKRFLDEQGDRVPYPTFTQVRMPGSKKLGDLLGETVFDYPKDSDVIARWIGAITRGNPDALILDFFAGSGTTAHAVMSVNAADGGNRRFIMVQLDETTPESSAAREAGFENIAQLSRERIRRAGAKIKDEAGLTAGSLDLGFRALKVDSTNYRDVRLTPDNTDQGALDFLADNIKVDRTPEDLLFEVMIDWGLDLALPIEQVEIAGTDVLVVDQGGLVACFAHEVSDAVIRGIAELKPTYAVFRDATFAADDAQINAKQIFTEVSPDTALKVI